MKADVFPLPMLRPGQRARVSHVLGAGSGIARKLGAMGLLPGVEVSVLQGHGGPVLVRIGDGRIAIGRGMAQRVMVSLVGEME